MKVLQICVEPEIRRIHIQIEMPDPNCFLTSQVPHLPRRLFRLLPRLNEHSCDNPRAVSFRQECRNTEIPHLFEHLVIELQLQAQQNPSDLLRGETAWNWQQDPRGQYHVSVDYENELLAIASIRLAERILTGLDCRDMSVNMELEIARLRQILVLGEVLSSPAASKAATTATPSSALSPRPSAHPSWASAAFLSVSPPTRRGC